PPAPIQVLGYLETTGLQFSHLWVAGLSDANWPLSPAPNPLIPMDLQRQCGIPRIDHPSEGAFAQRRIQHWRTACHHLTTSWFPAQAEGGEACSALIRPLTEVSIDVAVGNHRRRRHPWLARVPEPASEAAPPDQATPQDEEIRGGTSLVRDQAECPFRAWAVHRLGLKAEQSVEPFPDALTRGTVVHEAFHKLYRDHERPFSGNAVSTAVAATVAERLADTPARFRANEQSRIEAIIDAWLEHEAKRPAFSVIGLEQDAELTMPGARFFLRIDRIDQDAATGAQIVIDYKTGAVSVNRLLDERLVEPQLPMYALTDERIQAVLYARVGDEEIRLDGWGADSLSAGRSPEGGWDLLRDRWREQISALIEEFRSGKADVAPYRPPQTCRYCHLPSLCRVNAFMSAP
ncbi:MAG: PD-(D/E)XK nuclease family protein, partial [Gammaproteobacteria bacterium]|nr:PD-(D/E)XK nuclease family protein [Gammaproteobacteria bacterium]